MAEIPKRYFERFFVLGGFAFIAFLLWGAFWVQDNRKLDIILDEVKPRFKSFKAYESYDYLPSIKVVNPDGSIIDLQDNEGKFTILNIWATWCTPCVKELPSLGKLNNLLPYDSGWRIVAVSIDTKKNFPKIAKYTARFGVEGIANYYDFNLELQKNIDVSKLPMTLIINKSGRILYEIHGRAHWYDKNIIDFLKLVRKVR